MVHTSTVLTTKLKSPGVILLILVVYAIAVFLLS